MHSVFTALADHVLTRYARIIYFPEAAPADAGKRMYAYAKVWNQRYAGGTPKILVVHEGGLGENRQPLPGCRNTHDIKETGVNHLRLQMLQNTVKRLDSMIYLTNLKLGPGEGVIGRDILERHVLDTETKQQFLRFMKRSFKSNNEYVPEKYTYSGKAGALQDDLVIPHIMQAYWLDVMFGSTSQAWQAMSAKRRSIVTEQPRIIPVAYRDEVERLKKEGHDIAAPEPSKVTKQAKPLPFNATAMHARDTRNTDWTETLSDQHRSVLRDRRGTVKDYADERRPRALVGTDALTIDYDNLAEDADNNNILYGYGDDVDNGENIVF